MPDQILFVIALILFVIGAAGTYMERSLPAACGWIGAAVVMLALILP